ncbi:MAG: hypothetical protein ACW99J_17850 [Candidatus Thorarchaeota archaeon]
MIEFADLDDKEHRKILKVINGALKSCISAHGPITAYWIGSAGKRLMGALKSYDQGKKGQEEADAGTQDSSV